MTSHNFLLNDSVCKSVTQKVKRLLHFGPICGMGLVIFLTIVGLSVLVSTILPSKGLFGIVILFTYFFLSFFIMRSYALSAWYGPGFVKLGWKPTHTEDQAFLQFCALCEGFKPPRSHHCKTCGRCVLKMDHHCPWINSCVGHLNHGHFLHFVLSAPLGCLYCCILCSYRLYYVLTRVCCTICFPSSNVTTFANLTR
uniref:Palmitoyltransferase n=1 Tax=Mesocestoides corti TaxID=53468 RepID=A0A5K3FPI0_MESCO